MDVVPSLLASLWIHPAMPLREGKLPTPLSVCIGILAGQRVWQLDVAIAVDEVLLVDRLDALEMLMQPVGSSLLGALAGSLLGRTCAQIPAQRLPLTMFVWGPWRVAPVTLTALSIHETAFDELLNPIHASAEVGFSVLAPDDPDRGDVAARIAAKYYQGSRETRALLALAQLPELRR